MVFEPEVAGVLVWLELVTGPGEDGAAGAEGDRGADREVGAADDADHEGAVVGGTVGLDVEDGVVAVVTVGRDPAGQAVCGRRAVGGGQGVGGEGVVGGGEFDVLGADQDGDLVGGAERGGGGV